MSRRQADVAIAKGWIKVNGETVTTLGTKINPDTDLVETSDELQEFRDHRTTIMFHKPPGIVTVNPQVGEKEIKDLLPPEYKSLAPVGRLDKDSEGLILLTNDGVLSKKLLQGTPPHEREYEVEVNKTLTSEMIHQIEEGMFIQGRLTLPIKISLAGLNIYHFILREGRNRQIRRMIQKVGSGVQRLKRIRFGSLKLKSLEPGQYKELTRPQIDQI